MLNLPPQMRGAERDAATRETFMQATVSAIMDHGSGIDISYDSVLVNIMKANGYNVTECSNRDIKREIRQHVKARQQITIGMNEAAKVLIHHYSTTHKDKVDLDEDSIFLTEVMKIRGLASFVENKEIRKIVIGLVKSHLK